MGKTIFHDGASRCRVAPSVGSILLFLLAIGWTGGTLRAQYQVSGGAKTPVRAAENTAYKLEVYLVYGTDGVTISHTGTGTHRWYRYRTKAAIEDDWEAVASTQSGSTSTVTNPAEGYGYFVVDGSGELRRYVWIIDYSRYPARLTSLSVSPSSDACSSLRLAGTADLPALNYYLPDGKAMELKRAFEVSYLTQTWSEQTRTFTEQLLIDTLSGNPFDVSLSRPPLTDTKIDLTGDLFARAFGVEQTATIDHYQAVALEVHADTTLTSETRSNLKLKTGELSAPAEIRFRAQANTPVASLFVWQVTRREATGDVPIVRFTDPEMTYTFDRVGNYTVTLEVSDRSGRCTNKDNSYKISVTETVLEVPNVFSPESSPGVNDVFKVAHKSVVRFSASVFNRQGSLLYHWTNPNGGWDGRYRGQYVPAGAYYYVIEYTGTDGKTHRKSGDINVVRSSSNKNHSNQ